MFLIEKGEWNNTRAHFSKIEIFVIWLQGHLSHPKLTNLASDDILTLTNARTHSVAYHRLTNVSNLHPSSQKTIMPLSFFLLKIYFLHLISSLFHIPPSNAQQSWTKTHGLLHANELLHKRLPPLSTICYIKLMRSHDTCCSCVCDVIIR